MWAKVEDNAVTLEILNPREMTVGDVRHPAQIFSVWSTADLKEIGIYSMTVEAVDEDIYIADWDNPVYAIDNDNATVVKSPTKTERNIDDIKQSLGFDVNERAYTILLQSDWQITRAIESQLNANTANVAVSQSLLNYRNTVRTTANGKLLEVNALATVNAAATYDSSTGWPTVVGMANTVSVSSILEAEKNRYDSIIRQRSALFANT
jgi:hypothetical protein